MFPERQWFGTDWGAPACRELEHIPTPTGAPCLYCDEPISSNDDGYMSLCIRNQTEASMEPSHRECDLRQVIGSIGHQLGRCHCFGGTMGDPPGLTYRQAAKASRIFFEERRGYEIGLVAPDSITCFTCGRTSFNANDLGTPYCGHCKVFHLLRDHARESGIADDVWTRPS